VHQLVSAIGS